MDVQPPLKEENAERIRRAQETLTRLSQTLDAAIRRQAESRTTPGPQASGEPQDAEVVDAEFQDVEDQKR